MIPEISPNNIIVDRKLKVVNDKRLCMGSLNSPACLSIALQNIFEEHKFSDDVVFYADDILLSDYNVQALFEKLEKLLSILADAGLFISLSKTQLFVNHCNFLGFKITEDTKTLLKSHVEDLKKLQVPTNLKEVQRLRGLVNYYKNFLYAYSDIVKPLYEIKDSTGFFWREEQQKALELLKYLLTTEPILQQPDQHEIFIIHTDSSQVALGAVISQNCRKDGLLHPVIFFSRLLSPNMRKWSIFSLELRAIMECFKVHQALLLMSKCIVFTDHKPLSTILIQSKPPTSAKILRMVMFLSKFDIEIRYIKGCHNVIADILSRASSSDANTRENRVKAILKHKTALALQQLKPSNLLEVAESEVKDFSTDEDSDLEISNDNVSELSTDSECDSITSNLDYLSEFQSNTNRKKIVNFKISNDIEDTQCEYPNCNFRKPVEQNVIIESIISKPRFRLVTIDQPIYSHSDILVIQGRIFTTNLNDMLDSVPNVCDLVINQSLDFEEVPMIMQIHEILNLKGLKIAIEEIINLSLKHKVKSISIGRMEVKNYSHYEVATTMFNTCATHLQHIKKKKKQNLRILTIVEINFLLQGIQEYQECYISAFMDRFRIHGERDIDINDVNGVHVIKTAPPPRRSSRLQTKQTIDYQQLHKKGIVIPKLEQKKQLLTPKVDQKSQLVTPIAKKVEQVITPEVQTPKITPRVKTPIMKSSRLRTPVVYKDKETKIPQTSITQKTPHENVVTTPKSIILDVSKTPLSRNVQQIPLRIPIPRIKMSNLDKERVHSPPPEIRKTPYRDIPQTIITTPIAQPRKHMIRPKQLFSNMPSTKLNTPKISSEPLITEPAKEESLRKKTENLTSTRVEPTTLLPNKEHRIKPQESIEVNTSPLKIQDITPEIPRLVPEPQASIKGNEDEQYDDEGSHLDPLPIERNYAPVDVTIVPQTQATSADLQIKNANLEKLFEGSPKLELGPYRGHIPKKIRKRIEMFAKERYIEKLDKKVLIREQLKDPYYGPIMEHIRLGRTYSDQKKSRQLMNLAQSYCLIDGILYFFRETPNKWGDLNLEIAIKHPVLVIPEYLVSVILEQYHNSMATVASIHPGETVMFATISCKYEFKNMMQQIKDYIRACLTCSETKPKQKPSQSIPKTWINNNTSAFSDVVSDLADMPITKSTKFTGFVVWIEASTGFILADPIRDSTAKTVVNSFEKSVAPIALPLRMHSDRGACYIADLYKQTMAAYNIEICLGTPQTSSSQGLAEASIKLIKKSLRDCQFHDSEGVVWDTYFRIVIYALNNLAHSKFKVSRSEMLLGIKSQEPIDRILNFNVALESNVPQNATEKVQHLELKRDLHKKIVQRIRNKNLQDLVWKIPELYVYTPGENVFLRHISHSRSIPHSRKFTFYYEGGYTVVATPTETHVLLKKNNVLIPDLIHVNRIKPDNTGTPIGSSVNAVNVGKKISPCPVDLKCESDDFPHLICFTDMYTAVRFHLINIDILEVEIDVLISIINENNESRRKLIDKAGQKLKTYLRRSNIEKENNEYVTPGYNLKAEFILHIKQCNKDEDKYINLGKSLDQLQTIEARTVALICSEFINVNNSNNNKKNENTSEIESEANLLVNTILRWIFLKRFELKLLDVYLYVESSSRTNVFQELFKQIKKSIGIIDVENTSEVDTCTENKRNNNDVNLIVNDQNKIVFSESSSEEEENDFDDDISTLAFNKNASQSSHVENSQKRRNTPPTIPFSNIKVRSTGITKSLNGQEYRKVYIPGYRRNSTFYIPDPENSDDSIDLDLCTS